MGGGRKEPCSTQCTRQFEWRSAHFSNHSDTTENDNAIVAICFSDPQQMADQPSGHGDLKYILLPKFAAYFLFQLAVIC